MALVLRRTRRVRVTFGYGDLLFLILKALIISYAELDFEIKLIRSPLVVLSPDRRLKYRDRLKHAFIHADRASDETPRLWHSEAEQCFQKVRLLAA